MSQLKFTFTVRDAATRRPTQILIKTWDSLSQAFLFARFLQTPGGLVILFFWEGWAGKVDADGNAWHMPLDADKWKPFHEYEEDKKLIHEDDEI